MSGLSSIQLSAVEMMVGGSSHVEIASKLGISTKTVQRWQKLPAFNQAITEVQQRTLEAAIADIAGHIEQLVPKAIKVLESYLDNPNAKGSDRLRAVQILGNWAGLNQAQPKQDNQPEQNLKDYLQFLAVKNGNGHSNSPDRD